MPTNGYSMKSIAPTICAVLGITPPDAATCDPIDDIVADLQGAKHLALLAPDVAVLILADHGQHDVPDAAEGENRGKHGFDRPEDRLAPCTWAAPEERNSEQGSLPE